MDDLISRQEVIRLILERGLYCDTQADREISAEIIRQLPSAQPETHEERTETHARDLISRQAAIMHFVKVSKNYECGMFDLKEVTHELWQLPSAQPKDDRLERCKFEYLNACKTITYPTPDTSKGDIHDAYAVIKALHPIFGDVEF